jgi:hypothetical protein
MMAPVTKFNPDATLVDLKLATVRWYETEGEDRVAIKQMLLEIASELAAPASMVRDIQDLPTDSRPSTEPGP